jgi:hypothetical protein
MFPYLRIGILALSAIVLLVVTFALPAHSSVCPPGTVQIGEEREETPTEIIIHPVCQQLPVVPVVDPALARSICSAKRKIAADLEAIRLMNFEADTESFEKFEGIAREQKAEITKKLLFAVLDQGIDEARTTAKKLQTLNIKNVRKEIKKLESFGLDKNQKVSDAMYKIAQSTDKRKKIKAYNLLLKEIKTAKAVYSTGTGMAKDSDNAGLRFLLGALQIAQSNPALGLLVTSADVSENFAYLYYLTGQIDDLSKLTDDRMKILNERITEMKQDMSAFKTAKKKWQAYGMSGEPACE